MPQTSCAQNDTHTHTNKQTSKSATKERREREIEKKCIWEKGSEELYERTIRECSITCTAFFFNAAACSFARVWSIFCVSFCIFCAKQYFARACVRVCVKEREREVSNAVLYGAAAGAGGKKSPLLHLLLTTTSLGRCKSVLVANVVSFQLF